MNGLSACVAVDKHGVGGLIAFVGLFSKALDEWYPSPPRYLMHCVGSNGEGGFHYEGLHLLVS